jgi:hypothetical protein
MGAVKKAVAGATSFLVGGKEIPATTSTQAMTNSEQDRQADIEAKLNELYAQSDNGATSDLFKQHLTSFLTGDQSTVPNADQIARAKDFVNQTFGNPAEAALQDYEGKFNASQQATAASLGRNPNADQATQQAMFNEGMRTRRDLENERGSRVAQTALGFNDQAYNRDATSLGYLNNLTQQAFGNRMNLLNARSGINASLQRDRLSNLSSTKGGTTSGLLTNATAVGKGLNDFQYQWWNRPIKQTGGGYADMMSFGQASNIGGGLGGGGGGGMGAGGGG